MLWDIRALMKPALSVIDLLPGVHRTPALTTFRMAVLHNRPPTWPLLAEDKDLAFLDAPVQLTSPIGARMLKALYHGGHLRLKKPAVKSLPALDQYIATEGAFRAEVTRILAADAASHLRLTAIIAQPGCARPDELTPTLIDKVMTAHLGRTALGSLQIAGIACHRSLSHAHTAPSDSDRLRAEGKVICWWLDGHGNRQGDPD